MGPRVPVPYEYNVEYSIRISGGSVPYDCRDPIFVLYIFLSRIVQYIKPQVYKIVQYGAALICGSCNLHVIRVKLSPSILMSLGFKRLRSIT